MTRNGNPIPECLADAFETEIRQSVRIHLAGGAVLKSLLTADAYAELVRNVAENALIPWVGADAGSVLFRGSQVLRIHAAPVLYLQPATSIRSLPLWPRMAQLPSHF